MVMVLAPKEVIPPIPRNKNCTMRHKNSTVTPVKGPSKITTNGIINRWIGTPKGEGMDIEDTAIVTAARIAVLTSILSFSSVLESL
ncbi:MAG: hypothetical protein A4E25_01200 [Methanobacterium sp. PtaB.Bin024]|nr:MAG: hypothetical protein A4E25_01200 [Methanobacterium sp. PtaB.Bin024]